MSGELITEWVMAGRDKADAAGCLQGAKISRHGEAVIGSPQQGVWPPGLS